MAETSDTISIHIDGVPENGKDLRLGVFVEKIGAFRGALKDADNAVNKSAKSDLDFFVVGLTKENPCEVALKPIPRGLFDDDPLSGFNHLVAILSAVAKENPAQFEFDYSVLSSLKQLGDGIGQKFSRIWFSKNRTKVIEYSRESYAAICHLLNNTISSYGSVTGRVERYNSHSDEKHFYVYPRLGGRVKCFFSSDLRESCSAAVDKYVTVSGKLKTRYSEYLPFEIEVLGIEVHPSSDELPRLAEFEGVAATNKGEDTSRTEVGDGWH